MQVKRIKIFESEGKTRDERESYFPSQTMQERNENKGAGMR